MNLPPEMLSLICGLMSKETLKCARMTCKALEQAAVSFLFDEVFISSTYFDIEVANHIITRFAQHIKTIALCFPHFVEYPEDFANVESCELSNLSRDCIEAHQKHAFATYCKARAEHIQIIEDGELLVQLRQVLMRSPAARNLALRDQGYGFEHQDDEWYTHEVWKRGDLCPFESCPLSKLDHVKFYLGPGFGYSSDDPDPWDLILPALSAADPPITRIVSMSTHNASPIPMDRFIMAPRQAQNVTMRFQILTKLQLSLLHDTDTNKEYLSRVANSSVSRALSAAVNLQTLSIDVDYDLEAGKPYIWTLCSFILGGCRFPKLKSLRLVNIDAQEDELLNLLGASPRLENLLLCCFVLLTGFWASAAARMKSILQLKRMEFADLLGGFLPFLNLGIAWGFHGDHRLVEDFFLREGENPFTDQAIKDFYDNNDQEQRWKINAGIGDWVNHFETYH